MTSEHDSLPSGIDTAHVSRDIRPQDDFFRYVNGTWLRDAVIPADRGGYGAFVQLVEESEARVRTIIEDLSVGTAAPGSNEQKIGDLFAAFMDEERIEALGLSPIADDLALAGSVQDATELVSVMGQLEVRGSGGLFYSYVTSDKRDSNTNIAYLGQAGLSLPDEAYYREEQYAPLRDGLVAHITRMFALVGIDDGAAHADRILQLETAIASHHWDQVQDRDAERTYNKFTLDELIAISQGFDWATWLRASATPDKVLADVIVRQPSFFTGIGQLLSDFDAPAWRSWLTWHVLSGAAPYLSRVFVDENFSFYGTQLSGIPTLRERWKRGVSTVEGALGEAVGEEYVARHFPPAAKARMVELVQNLIEAYRVDIAALDWMTDETKQRAFTKLDKFTPKIGYPDTWRDYSTLTIEPGDLVGNLRAVTAFERDYVFAKIGAPVDRTEWHMTPQTVNAYYNPGMNEIVFPAAILQPPFFDLAADDAVNYGGIGAVIGHEIGHGFDDQGSKYDGDGNLSNWWTDADRDEFEKRTAALIAQYDALVPDEAPDVHVNGALTIGENIGDLGGLTIAFKAYQLSLQGGEPPVLDGFTGYQRVFVGWAQVWRHKTRPEEARQRIAVDPHSPAEFRCNQVVKNLVEFYEAFDVREGDALYLPEDERVRIW